MVTFVHIKYLGKLTTLIYRNSLTWNLNSKRAFVVGGYHKILVNQTSNSK